MQNRGELPGGLVLRAQCFHPWGQGSILDLETEMPHRATPQGAPHPPQKTPPKQTEGNKMNRVRKVRDGFKKETPDKGFKG